MQPNRNETEWQQPKEQPSQAPYAASAVEAAQPSEAQPVVTLTPDQPQVSQQQPAPSPPDQTPSMDDQLPTDAKTSGEDPVHWQAHEYIHREKGSLWFVIFAVVVVGLIAAAIFLVQSITFAVLIPVMAAALIVYTRRPPRILDYTLSHQGLHINDHLYPFADFKAFGVVRDGEEYSIMLIPTKRFRPGVSVYFPEASGEAIVDMLGARLPMEELHLDMIDRIIRKLRI